MTRRRQRAARRPAAPESLPPSAPSRRTAAAAVLGVVCFVAAALVIYAPALHGGMLWDDAAHLTRERLRSLDGLYYIWFLPGATQQYYPLLHTAFWLEWQLWGANTFPYHVTNVVQHALGASLLWAVLRRLEVPGALLAATLFLVHPVNVESVAWLTEQKNTLSTIFYMAAAWSYLKFDASAEAGRRRRWLRSPGWYLLATLLFVLGLLTKTVIATLPPALLVVFWWKRGRLEIRRDVLPLLPWFAVGAAAGVFTAWAERVLIGAQGAEFQLGLLDRFVLAGRVVLFYLSKLAWPAELIFFYPRWTVDASQWTWWLYPIAMLALTAALLALAVRHRVRAPLAAFLFFGGTLFPVLGFLNVYPFRYSYVADHFQYLAQIGILTLVAGGVVLLAQRRPSLRRPVYGAAGLAVVLLAVLAWRQSDQYGHDAEYHYRAIIADNPNAWIAHGNLAWLLVEKGMAEEAIPMFHTALSINPQHFESLRDLGATYERLGDLEKALVYYERSLPLDPDRKAAENRYGRTLVRLGRAAEAIEHLERATALAIEEKTPIPRFHVDLALGYRAVGRAEDALEEFERARQLRGGDYPLATAMIADILVQSKRDEEALPYLRRAVEDDPSDAVHQFDLGRILFEKGQYADAVPHLEAAISARPELVDAHIVLALSRFEMGEPVRARDAALEALRIARSVLEPDVVRRIEQTLAPVLAASAALVQDDARRPAG